MAEEHKSIEQLKIEVSALRDQLSALKARIDLHQLAEQKLRENEQMLWKLLNAANGASCLINPDGRIMKALQEREEQYRSIFENSIDGIITGSPDGIIYAANHTFCQMVGRTEEEICRLGRSGVVDPTDQRLAVLLKERELTGKYRGEVRLKRSDGTTFPCEISSNEYSGKDGRKHVSIIIRDITKREQFEELLHLQYEIATSLSSAKTLAEASDLLLASLMRIGRFDSGGISIVDSQTHSLKLVSHRGISQGFVKHSSQYGFDTSQAKLVMQGEPIYWSSLHNTPGLDNEMLRREGLIFVAVLPIKHEDEVVAVLSVGSHASSEIDSNVRNALESIAAQIGGAILRIRAQEVVDEKRREVEDSNTALRVLIRQREEDRKNLEQSLLANVKNLVLPSTEKLRKTRLNPEQKLYLDAIENYLKDVASPFVSRLSYEFARLTPMEIRTCELLRQGKTSKEMAVILGTSESSILFHRQNIREKLKLKGKKVNLKSYLSNLVQP